MTYIYIYDISRLRVKRVATDMQHHVFSCDTLNCTVSICESINISYITGLLFTVTAAQMSCCSKPL
jgi:hypothetical protein